MTEHFNKSIMKQRRRALRKNLSKAEAIMWNYLSRRQMHGCKFRRQHSVDQYVIDFYCPELKIAIEIDGDSHFYKSGEELDKIRQKYLDAFGVRFLRFTNTEVYKNIEGICQVINNTIEEMMHSKENMLN